MPTRTPRLRHRERLNRWGLRQLFLDAGRPN